MSARFITYVIIGVAFGFTQLWFVYWVVKILKEKQRLITARKAGVPGGAAVAAEKRAPNHPEDAGTRGPGQA